MFNDRNHIKLPTQFPRNVLYNADVNEECVTLKSLIYIDLILHSSPKVAITVVKF